MCHYIDSQYILLQLEARVFRVPLKKKLDRWKVLSVWNNLIYNLWENDSNLNDIDSKHSSSHSFQGHNLHLWVMGFMHAFSFIFFSLVRIYFNFPNLKGMNCTTKIWRKKIWSPCSFKSYRPSYLFTWSIYWKQCCVVGICAGFFPWLCNFYGQ